MFTPADAAHRRAGAKSQAAMPATRSFTLERPGGITLRGACWCPAGAGGGARGADVAPARDIYLVHGLGEHVGRYDTLGAWLAARGWTLCGHDHHGHGRSDGRRGTIPATRDPGDDLEAALETRYDAGRPPLLMGHSLGGLVALSCALRHPQRIRGLVLTSPALDPGLGIWQKALVALMSRIAPDLALGNGLDASKLSHDPAVVRAYLDDPLVHDRISARLARFIVDASRRAIEQAGTLAVPTLLMYAGDDRLVDPAGSREFARRAPPSLLTVREYPALWHEILNESEPARRGVFDDLAAWLDGR